MLTKVLALEDVRQRYPRGDAAENVKRCIADHYRRHGVRYVLLVGDSDRFPVRFTKTDRKDMAAYDTAFYPTDFYYAALFKKNGAFDNWDTNQNGYYGELNGETHTGPINIDGVNLTPSIAVGRIPASTAAEVRRYVGKLICYEKAAFSASWAKKALLLATHDWDQNACKVQEALATAYLQSYAVRLLFSSGCPCPGAGTLTAAQITTEINLGKGVVAYIGHGTTSALAIPGGSWGVSNVDQLTNDRTLPVMAVAGCDTAQFATLPPYCAYVDINNVEHAGTVQGERFSSPPPQPSCFQTQHDPDQDLASRLTVGTEAGVVAYLGGVTGMQMSEPVQYFIRRFASAATLGEAWQWMITHFYAVFGQPGSLTAPDRYAVARVHQPWKYMLFGDPSLRIRGAVEGLWSPQQLTSGDRGTSNAPALAVFQNKLYMVWKGKDTDPRIYFSVFDGYSWSPQQLTSSDRGTSNAPALAVFQNKLYMVWKGKDTDPRIYFSVFDGYSWSPQQLTSGDRGTSNAPALAVFQNKLYMVWKGKDTDPRIYFSVFDGYSWSPQQLTSGDRGTSNAPALAVFQNKLYMVWKGKDTDPRIYFSVFDGYSWSPQQLTSGDRGTSNAPALAVYRNKLFKVWKGKDTDPRIYFSVFDGYSWSPQQLTSSDRGTSNAPALAVHLEKLCMVWKGKVNDPKIYFSYLFADSWPV